MTYVSSTEFQNNVGKYFKMVADGDVTITRKGKAIVTLTKPSKQDFYTMPAPITDSLAGILGEFKDMTLDEIREGRLSKYL
ncbi:hypothetical protein FACS1894184_00300 [Clostridia bacterium]|nr:hypothetical protein FACS1894184_00300 [Clostridia bacterium]